MNAFTPREEQVLRIFAINRNQGDMKGFLRLSLLPFLDGQARLAGLIILGVEGKELSHISSRLSQAVVAEVVDFCVKVIVEADNALSELDSRIPKSKPSTLVPAV